MAEARAGGKVIRRKIRLLDKAADPGDVVFAERNGCGWVRQDSNQRNAKTPKGTIKHAKFFSTGECLWNGLRFAVDWKNL